MPSALVSYRVRNACFCIAVVYNRRNAFYAVIFKKLFFHIASRKMSFSLIITDCKKYFKTVFIKNTNYMPEKHKIADLLHLHFTVSEV